MGRPHGCRQTIREVKCQVQQRAGINLCTVESGEQETHRLKDDGDRCCRRLQQIDRTQIWTRRRPLLWL